MLEMIRSGALNGADLRFLETKLQCGVWTRKIGADEMYWSRGLFELLDLDPETDKPSFNLMRSMQHPDDRLTFAQANANLETGKSFERKYRVIRRNGTVRTLLHRGEVLVNQSGQPDHAIAVVCDVTEQEDLMRRLELLEKRIEAVVSATGMIINIVSPDGSVIGLLGSKTELEPELDRRFGLNWRKLIHPDDLEGTLKSFEEAVTSRQCGFREHRVLDRLGNYQWRRVSWSPIFSQDQSLRELVSTSINIDKEKVPQSSPEEAQKLTGAQVRAARAIINWSVRDLAEKSGISFSTIRRIEENDREIGNQEDAAQLRKTLTGAGVEFLFPLEGKPGVRPS